MADQVNVKFGADTSQLNAAIDVVTSKTQGYSKSLMAQFAEYDKQKAAAVNSMTAITTATGNAAHAAEGLSFATAGAKRELIVLAHEAVSGNFSRIPGSIMILAERMGGLSLSIMGAAGAFSLVTYASYEWLTAIHHHETAITNVRLALRDHNQELSFNRELIESNITTMKKMTGESTQMSTQIVSAFMAAGGISVELKQKLLGLVVDFAAATNQTVPNATQQLIKMFQEPKKGLEDFARAFPEKVEPALLRTALLTSDVNKQQQIMFSMMESLHRRHVENLSLIERAWQTIGTQIAIVTGSTALLSKSTPLGFKSSSGTPEGNAQEEANAQRRNEIEQIIGQKNRLASEEAQIERLRIQEEINNSQQVFEQKKERLDAEVSLHRITKLQEIEQLRQASEQEYQIQLELMQREREIANLGPLEKQRINNQIELLHSKHNTELLKLDSQRAQEQNRLHTKELQQWRPIIDTIGRGFDGMLQGILQGTQTWQQAMGNFFTNMAATAISAIGQIVVEWLLFMAVTEGQGTWDDFMTLQGGPGGGGGGGVLGRIFSFDVGTDRVPNDMLAMVHKDEIIIPASQSNAIRSGEASVGSGGNVSIIIQAIDTQTGAQFLMNNSAAIAKAVTHQMRNGNAGLQHAMRG